LDIYNQNLQDPCNLEGFVNLEYLNFSDNQLTSLDFLNDLNAKKITRLYISNNKISSDLTPFSRLVNLEKLGLGSNDQERVKRSIYNNFAGSLKPLAELTKLYWLNIRDTDIDSGLEYLPESIREFGCSVGLRKNAKVKTIYNLFANEKGEVEIGSNGEIKNFSQKFQGLKNN